MKNRNIAHILRAAQETPWAILPGKLEQIRAFLYSRINTDLTAEELAKEYQAKVVGPSDVAKAQRVGNIAVIPVFGTVSQRMNMFSEFSGGTSTQQLAAAIARAASEPDVAAIVLDVDSPGGTVQGLPELHASIMNARNQKPIVASVNALAASAAYWIASAANEISITPSGEAGSIGVFYLHEDLTKALEAEGVTVSIIKAGKFKAEGSPYEPLSDDARAAIQSTVDHFYNLFVQDVAAGRGVPVSDVRSQYGEGRLMTASKAKAAGMVDRIESLDETLSRLAKKGNITRVGNSKANAEKRLDMGAKFLR